MHYILQCVLVENPSRDSISSSIVPCVISIFFFGTVVDMSTPVSLLVAGLLLLCLVPHSIGSSESAQGLCPFSKKPPSTPAKLPRCVRYQNSSCCDACLDWNTAATAVSVNGTYVANALFPPGFTFPGIEKFKQSTVSGTKFES